MSLKIICVEFENLKLFASGALRVDFVATDRVLKNSGLFKISGNVATQNVIGTEQTPINIIERHTACSLVKM